MSAQVARLEELLARVQRNRLRLAEEMTAAQEVVDDAAGEAAVEMRETVDESPAPVQIPVAEYEEADIDTPAETDMASIPPTPAQSERETLVVTDAAQIRQTLVADVIPLEPDVEEDEPAPMDDIEKEPEPIALTVSSRVSSVPPPEPPSAVAESRVFAPDIAARPVVQVRRPLEETSWTLSAVLDRAWQLGGR